MTVDSMEIATDLGGTPIPSRPRLYVVQGSSDGSYVCRGSVRLMGPMKAKQAHRWCAAFEEAEREAATMPVADTEAETEATEPRTPPPAPAPHRLRRSPRRIPSGVSYDCGKTAYGGQKEARAAIVEWHRNRRERDRRSSRPMIAYRCSRCGWYHLGHAMVPIARGSQG